MEKREDCPEVAIKKYSNMVYRLAFAQMRNKSDAEDVYQEVFLRYIRKKPSFDSEEHQKAWLLRVTINCCKKNWGLSWRKTIPLEGDIVFQKEEERYLYEELGKLPIKYRRVIHLFYYEDLSIESISKILEQKPSTTRTQLTRARQKLKEILKEDYDV